MAYLPIEAHGVIGDLHTVALVADDGTIDWWCPERFDRPSVFAALLDDARGGAWALGPAAHGGTRKQLYVPDSNVLITRFMSADGAKLRCRRPRHRGMNADWPPMAARAREVWASREKGEGC